MISRLTATFDRLSVDSKRKMIAAFDRVPSQLAGEYTLPEAKEASSELKKFYQKRLEDFQNGKR